MTKVFLLTGSNMGNRLSNLAEAKTKLAAQIGNPVSVSSIYETAAWGKTDQQAFLNQVLQFETELLPHGLLQLVLATETDMGRIRTEKWGSRLIDIDVLFYGQQVVQLPDLTIPHPFIQERRFTLVPLCEIAPEWIHPLLKHNMQELLENCPDTLEVKKI